ncbi:hypothetical protein CHH80_10915 [Bacillus sp. 7504-2]|jgi:nitrate reductase beta subunit|nr:hypothetical protein CHH80_10915 [Bacillus sp. 7504-2]
MKNLYEIKDDYTIIFVKRKGETYEVMIDTDDLELVSNFKGTWHLDNRGYIRRVIQQRVELLHRLITNPPKDMVVDHIDCNPLNNRRSNLRIVTWGQNTQNITSNKRSKVGIRGVSLDNRWNPRWRARLRVDGKDINLGYYDTKEEAEAAVIKGRAKYFPFSKEATYIKD